MRLVAAALLFAALSPIPAVACGAVFYRERVVPDDHRFLALLNDATGEFGRGEHLLALTHATRVLANVSAERLGAARTARAHRIIGESALAIGRWDVAGKHLALALRSFPRLAEPLARAHLESGKPRDAVAVLERSAKRKALDADAWATLGEAKHRVGDDTGAQYAARVALAQQPDHKGALALKARLAPPQAPQGLALR